MVRMGTLKPTLAIVISALVGASAALAAQAREKPTLTEIGRSALRYVESHQIENAPPYYPGEWRTQVTSTLPTLLGVGLPGKAFEEPTAFVTGSIMNLLADLYLRHPEAKLEMIPPMLEKARQSLEPYREKVGFNYYQPYTLENGIQVRRTAELFLLKPWLGFTYIPADADTTSVASLALFHLDRVRGGQGEQPPAEVLAAFERHSDRNRPRSHGYNKLFGVVDSGAFLTWLMDDADPSMPGSFDKSEAGPRIPLGVNDVDCIVNGNVLRLLSATGNTGSTSYRNSCDYLRTVVRKKQYASCGLYYPNAYLLPYVLAQTLAAGADCLEDTREQVISFILQNQETDGSWVNRGIGRLDPVQSTLWALGALLKLGKPEDPRILFSVAYGIHYLKTQMRESASGEIHWEGGVYFSAVAQVRNSVLWRSTDYTTALAATVFFDAVKVLGD
ncbi:MAG: hypothetical protein NDJ89_04690 [Oligoflexia bacterium]|nr:hypothetical protein [Oligoflexia bacterium]